MDIYSRIGNKGVAELEVGEVNMNRRKVKVYKDMGNKVMANGLSITNSLLVGIIKRFVANYNKEENFSNKNNFNLHKSSQNYSYSHYILKDRENITFKLNKVHSHYSPLLT